MDKVSCFSIGVPLYETVFWLNRIEADCLEKTIGFLIDHTDCDEFQIVAHFAGDDDG